MLNRRPTDRQPVSLEALKTGLMLRDIADDLNVLYLERTELVSVLITALSGGFPTSIISAPGTGKTAIIDDLFSHYIDAPSFGWLMTRYTTPDEIFGAPSLKALSERDELVRNMDDKLPSARTIKLDECFKANSATLNAQLEALNEKRFEGVSCPWVAWIGASNEYPDGIGSGSSDGDSLGALWDRYILRVELDYLASESSVESLLFSAVEGDRAQPVTSDQLAHMQSQVGNVWVPQEVRDAFIAMRRQLMTEGITVSDRSWRRAVRVVQARALAMGRDAAKLSDLTILAHVLWETPDQRAKVAETVRNVGAPEIAVALTCEADVASLAQDFRAATGAEMQTRGHALTERCEAHIAALEHLSVDDDEISDEIERVVTYLDSLRQEVAETIFAQLRGRVRRAADAAQ